MKKNIEVISNVRETVAKYQGQATLGKIVNVILHEGRRPLNYFKNQIENINFWMNYLKNGYNKEAIDTLIPLVDGLGKNSDIFAALFKKIDPLASGKRGPKREFNLYAAISSAVHVYENELIENKISVSIIGNKDYMFFGWKQDIYAIFTNLIDNSIYWIKDEKSKERKITIEIQSSQTNEFYIDYKDSGPGIDSILIEENMIFDPEFSKKEEGGCGLGLAICGESASRNNLDIKALNSNNGAYFRIQKMEMTHE